MFLNNINFVNFFDLRYNLNVVPADARQLILGDSQKLVGSLSSIGRNFSNSSQEEQNDMIKKFLKVYCISKGYNYRNILNIINSKTIVNSKIYPFQNASIESGILNQHGMEICVEFAQELTEDEQTLFLNMESIRIPMKHDRFWNLIFIKVRDFAHHLIFRLKIFYKSTIM